MENPIFPNCSYFVAVGGSDIMNMQLQEAIALHGTRSFFCSDCQDLERTSEAMRRIAGLVIFSDSLKAEDLTRALKLAESRAIPVRIISGVLKEPSVLQAKVDLFAPDGAFELLKEIVDRFVDEMIPLGLRDILINAANQVIPKFIPGLGQFEAIVPDIHDFDRQLNFSLAMGDVVGYSAALIHVEEIAQMLPAERKDHAVADLQEGINQCLGMIVQSLVTIGLDGKLGLPTIFDTTKIPEIQTMLFFPSVRIVDSKKRLHLSLGFVHLNDAPLFDLSGIKPGTGSDDVEFL